MSFFGISIAGSALAAAQQAENVTSDNIANANTPGASRQEVVLNEAAPIPGSPDYPEEFNPGTFGSGVVVQSIQRIHQNILDTMYRGASSSQNYYTTEQTTLNETQSQLNEPTNGINALYTTFINSIATASTETAGSSQQAASESVLTAAQQLASGLNTASQNLQTQEATLVSQGSTLVSQANGYLDQIASLNGEIRAMQAVGDNPNTYLDQRDSLIDQLSAIVPTQTSIQANGSALVAVNGQALVNDTVAYHLSDPVIGTNPDGTVNYKVDFVPTNGAAAPAPTAPGIPLGSGQLAAFADLYNNKLSSYGTQLDNFASALANEVNRVTESGYTAAGGAGGPLFQASVPGVAVTAGNIQVAVTSPSNVTVALANTAASGLMATMASANNTIDTSAALTNYASLEYPPAGPLVGTLTVNVNGVAQVFNYNTGTTDATVNDFITHFNSAHLGVTASFDGTSQEVVFAQDPSNSSLTLRAQQGAGATTPSFSITDSNVPPAPQPPGTAATSLLEALGASAIQGISMSNLTVPGVSANAYGGVDNSAMNALSTVLNSDVGIPGIQTTGLTAVAGPGVATVTLPAGITDVRVGQVLTVDSAPGGTQENVTVSAINISNPAAPTFTADFTAAHLAGFSISSAQTQTLASYYGTTITQVGFDAQTANTGTTTQTALAQSLDSSRQSVSGINLDEESQNLVKYQTAYQAAAKTINVMETLITTLLDTIGPSVS